MREKRQGLRVEKDARGKGTWVKGGEKGQGWETEGRGKGGKKREGIRVWKRGQGLRMGKRDKGVRKRRKG